MYMEPCLNIFTEADAITIHHVYHLKYNMAYSRPRINLNLWFPAFI